MEVFYEIERHLLFWHFSCGQDFNGDFAVLGNIVWLIRGQVVVHSLVVRLEWLGADNFSGVLVSDHDPEDNSY